MTLVGLTAETAPDRKTEPADGSGSGPVAAQSLNGLASGPRGLGGLATDLLEAAHGEPGKTVLNILYYLRDQKGLVKRREEDDQLKETAP
ncbi:hypothetical protein ACMHYB_25485 [Sorangium sp. So ce1128]